MTDPIQLAPPDGTAQLQDAAAAHLQACADVVVAGTVLMERWRAQVPALLIMRQVGMEGGRALAEVLSGAVNPSGHLPFAVQAWEERLPAFDRGAAAVTDDRWHGRRLLDRLGVVPACLLGWSLGYSEFAIEEARLGAADGDHLTLGVRMVNRGSCDGVAVVQVCGRRTGGVHPGETFLLGFAAVPVGAGLMARTAVEVSLMPMAA